jgi:sigma-B regulation protein RsbU (phosphoserine phosphatase)
VETNSSILVVDDDEANRESLRRRLERRGYTVAVAVDGKQALEQTAARPFDLIILDVMMPGMSGLEVLATLRKTHPATQLPIIMATALDDSADIVAALDGGANDYVTKPLDFAVVGARVRVQLELKKSVDRILALESQLQARNEELDLANGRLTKAASRTARELSAAAKVQQAFLPHANPHIIGAKFSWVFEPCTELAGDSLNGVQLDPDNVALYVLDVSGHGVAASLLAVSVTRLLSPSASGDSLVLHTQTDGTRQIAEPSEIAVRLAQNFSMDVTEQFITLFYAVYNTQTRDLTYVSAGHPGAIRVSRGSRAVILDGTGLPIGVGEKYEQQSVRLGPGDRIYLYSDGVTEVMDESRTLFGIARLLDSLSNSASESLTQSISLLQNEVTLWRGNTPVKDDMSILGMECC